MTDQQLKPRVCSRTGCGCAGTMMVRLRLRPPRESGNQEIESFLDIVLCDDHGATVSAADVITDKAWGQLCGMFERLRLKPPDRGRTAVDAVPIDEAPLPFRSRYAAADA